MFVDWSPLSIHLNPNLSLIVCSGNQNVNFSNKWSKIGSPLNVTIWLFATETQMLNVRRNDKKSNTQRYKKDKDDILQNRS